MMVKVALLPLRCLMYGVLDVSEDIKDIENRKKEGVINVTNQKRFEY